MGPFLSPEVFVREKSVTNLVVHFDKLLGFLLLDQILWELFHRTGDSMEEVTRPGDTTRDCWQVTNNWWSTLLSLILILDMVDLQSIVVEENAVLGVQAVLQVVSM